ncbi:hypothetical protein CQA31_10895 [Citrobacter freundii]|nr:hypothetical protein CQA31_10895 [Citrobacter freundii]
MKHENYLVFCIKIRHHIKTGNSQPLKVICQSKSRLIQINKRIVMLTIKIRTNLITVVSPLLI